MTTRNVHVLVLPEVHLLDLAGPVQAFYEANGFGADYRIVHCATERRLRSAQGLVFAELAPLPDVGPRDTVLVPGLDSGTLDRLSGVPTAWLRDAHAAGARIASICSGAFALAAAGLLDGKECTTHWKVCDRLQARYPQVRLVRNRLFVADGSIVTSAGVASGIDMAFALIEADHGPLVVARVAREMVVYMRRAGEAEQISAYLDFRTHLHEGVHRAQDWIVAHPDRNPSLHDLARIAAMSPRNLTRVFRQATGITLKTFVNRVKLQIARDLFGDPGLSVEGVSHRCGFKDSRHLRRLWRQTFGTSPSAWRIDTYRDAAR